MTDDYSLITFTAPTRIISTQPLLLGTLPDVDTNLTMATSGYGLVVESADSACPGLRKTLFTRLNYQRFPFFLLAFACWA